jgi:dihydroorotase-like cyclic amidohydrolase
VALLAGDIDTVATDHVHRNLASKQGGIWSASPGCPGLETLLPVLLSEGHHKRGLALESIAALTATNPARLMGMANTKGTIMPGMDADLTFIDLNGTWTLERADVMSSAGYSLYEGWSFKGRVMHAMVRGRWVLRDCAVIDAAKGTGRFIKRGLIG